MQTEPTTTNPASGEANPRRSSVSQGCPGLVIATGGSAEAGTAAAAGAEIAWVFRSDVITLGGEDTQDIRVPGAPPRAAEIRWVTEDDEWLFVDVSAAASSVDGARWVTCPLCHGDRIEVGDATFVFQRDEITDDGRAAATSSR